MLNGVCFVTQSSPPGHLNLTARVHSRCVLKNIPGGCMRRKITRARSLRALRTSSPIARGRLGAGVFYAEDFLLMKFDVRRGAATTAKRRAAAGLFRIRRPRRKTGLLFSRLARVEAGSETRRADGAAIQ